MAEKTNVKISKSQIDRCGEILRSEKMGAKHLSEEYEDALRIVDEWRANHLYAMNSMKMMLYRRIRHHYSGAIIAQRLKRMVTIIDKLDRFGEMGLSRMQDVCGIRVIMKEMDEVYALKKFLERPRKAYKLIRCNDYILNPKDDGYRGIHMVFKYHGSGKNAECCDGMLVEVQIRTKTQHVWATSVEMAGLVTGDRLKSDLGNKKWLEFFRLFSQTLEIAERLNDGGRKFVPDRKLNSRDICGQLYKLDEKEHISEKLIGFSAGIKAIPKLKKAADYIITINPTTKRVIVREYEKNNYAKAVREYAEMETINAGTEIDQVLVTTEGMNSLKKAYPNYFVEVKEFVEYIRVIEQQYRLWLEKNNTV